MYKVSTIDEVKNSLSQESGSHPKKRSTKVVTSIYDDEDDLVIFSKYSYEREDADEERMRRRNNAAKMRRISEPEPKVSSPSPISEATRPSPVLGNPTAATEKVEEKKEERKGRTKKEKDAPKGPIASYVIFSNEMRPLLANGEGKHLSMIEMSRLIGVKWKALTTEERLPYEEEAKADRDRYMLEMHEYKLKKKAEGIEVVEKPSP